MANHKRQPIKPTTHDKHSLPNLRVEIERIRADSLKQDERILAGTQRSNAEDSGLLLKSQVTPSHSSLNQYRKSNEKWVVPKGEKVEEQKVALAKALLKEKEEKSKGGNDFKLNSLRNSMISVSSAEGQTNPLYSPSCRKEQSVNRDSRGEDDQECNVLIDDNPSPVRHVEEQAIVDLNSYRGEEGSRDLRRSEASFAEDNFKGSDSSRYLREEIPSPKLPGDTHKEVTPPALNGKGSGSPKGAEVSRPFDMPAVIEPAVTSNSSGAPTTKGESNTSSFPQNLQGVKAPSWMELTEGALKLSANDGVITIENTEGDHKNMLGIAELQEVGSPKEGAKKLFGEVGVHAKEIQTDVITSEVLNLLFDELMMDGLVLRELFKLQVELPKGIKTNIKAVKKYLARLCEFIGSSPISLEHFGKGVLHQLNCALGPTPEERLRLFHSETDDDNEDSSYAKISYEQVLDIDIYFDFEECLMVAFTNSGCREYGCSQKGRS